MKKGRTARGSAGIFRRGNISRGQTIVSSGCRRMGSQNHCKASAPLAATSFPNSDLGTQLLRQLLLPIMPGLRNRVSGTSAFPQIGVWERGNNNEWSGRLLYNLDRKSVV